VSQSIPSFAVTRSDHPRSAEERAQILEKPGFGLHFTDHMVEVRWDRTPAGNSQRAPMARCSWTPAAAVLHYGQEIFEGIKAYRHADGSDLDLPPGCQRPSPAAFGAAPGAAGTAGGDLR
jgi:branched-chain amino acid aminotransferase